MSTPVKPRPKIEEPKPAPPAPLSRKKQSVKPAWLLRLTVESLLIVISILAALAVDNWRQSGNNQRLALQSLEIFQREIRQNLARIDDVAPYHDGLRTVLTQAYADSTQDIDIRSIAEGLQPTVLLNTAWQTALATGALTHIDVETVSALSLTYSIQQRFVDDSRALIPRPLAHGTPLSDQPGSTLPETYAYLNQLVQGEQELRGVYEQALTIIKNALDGTAAGADGADTVPK